jgi:hypothetical protein
MTTENNAEQTLEQKDKEPDLVESLNQKLETARVAGQTEVSEAGATNTDVENDDDKVDEDGNKIEDEKDKVNQEGKEKNAEEQGESIDQNLVDKARELGFTDEEIVDLATDNPGTLENIAQIVAAKSDDSQTPAAEDAAKGEKEDKDTDKKVSEKEVDLSKFDPELVKEVIEPMQAKQKSLEEALKKANENEAANEEKRQEEILTAINADLDALTESFPVLGKSESMTTGQFKLREAVLGEALGRSELPSVKRSGKKWPEIMQEAATSILGESKVKNTGKKVLGKGKDVKPLFTSRPSGRKAQSDKSKSELTSEEDLAIQIATMMAAAPSE